MEPDSDTTASPSGKRNAPERTPTSLYAKMFINGFAKPSYIVFRATIEGVHFERSTIRSVLEEPLVRAPLLRSKIEMSNLGVPTHFVARPTSEWFDGGGLHVESSVDEEGAEGLVDHLMSTPMNLVDEFPFQVWLRHRVVGGEQRTEAFARLHHAVLDGHSAKRLAADILGGRSDESSQDRKDQAAAARERPSRITEALERARRGFRWLSRARLARVPRTTVLTDFTPSEPLDYEPVARAEREMPVKVFRSIQDHARSIELTFPQHVCATLFQCFRDYNAAVVENRDDMEIPDELGLMMAVSQRRYHRDGAAREGFAVETRLLRASDELLAPENRDRLRAYVRDEIYRRRAGHNHIGLAAMYVGRRISELVGSSQEASRPRIRGIHLSYSDLTADETAFREVFQLPTGDKLRDVAVYATPVAYDHAALLLYRYLDEVRFVLTYHSEAMDGDRLLDDLISRLTPDLQE